MMESTGLTQELDNLNLLVSAIENDVLFFLQKNHKASSNNEIIRVCKGYFTDDEICAAKDLLAKEYAEEIKKHDANAANNLIIVRRNSPVTCKLDTVILDIIKAFDALDAFDIDVDISAENESRIPNFISESASLAAVMDSIKDFGTRLTNAEKDITNLKSVNAKLVEENAKLIQENAGLRSALAVAKTPPPLGLVVGERGGVGEGMGEGVDGRGGGQGQPEGIEADSLDRRYHRYHHAYPDYP